MFGITDMLSGLVGGGLKMLGNMQSNEYARESAAQQMAFQRQQQQESEAFNAQRSDISMYYNATQADQARQFSAYQQEQAQGYNADQAQLNRDFQERMSSSAYQRSRADMAAAGLNPILAAGAGGASTPGGSAGSIGAVGGAQASSSPASVGMQGGSKADAVGLLEGVVSSAAEAARLKPTIDQIRQTTRIGKEQELKTLSENRLTEQLEAESRGRTDKIMSEKANVEADTQLKRDEAGKVRVFGSDFQPEKTQRVIGDYFRSRGGAKGILDSIATPGAQAIESATNSAVGFIRGLTGDGTGGR